MRQVELVRAARVFAVLLKLHRHLRFGQHHALARIALAERLRVRLQRNQLAHVHHQTAVRRHAVLVAKLQVNQIRFKRPQQFAVVIGLHARAQGGAGRHVRVSIRVSHMLPPQFRLFIGSRGRPALIPRAPFVPPSSLPAPSLKRPQTPCRSSARFGCRGEPSPRRSFWQSAPCPFSAPPASA